MASQLENEFGCMKHCWGVYQQNSIVNYFHIDSTRGNFFTATKPFDTDIDNIGIFFLVLIVLTSSGGPFYVDYSNKTAPYFLQLMRR